AIDPDKDADGLHPVNLGRLALGLAGPRPCTPLGIQEILVRYGVPIAGAHVVVVGRGTTVGRPLAMLLSLKEPNANATVTQCHTGTRDVAALARQADILVAATGRAGLITPEMVKPGAAVPDEPIIPFIEGDGTGVDIWPAARRVLDAAVDKAYGGAKRIAWKEVLAGQKAFDETGSWLPDETVEAFRTHIVGIKGPLTTP